MLDAMLGTLDTVVERLRALERSLNRNGVDGKE